MYIIHCLIYIVYVIPTVYYTFYKMNKVYFFSTKIIFTSGNHFRSASLVSNKNKLFLIYAFTQPLKLVKSVCSG